ncbi:hypothetical protein MHYP_G00317510 [Metynnis hypsauchen]
MDIRSRVAVLCAQAVQRLLYHERHAWIDLACALLRVAGHMGLDRHLFSLYLGTVSDALRVKFLEAGISKLRHVRRGRAWIAAELLADMVGLRSVCMVLQVPDQLRSDLSVSVLENLDTVPVEDCRSEMVDFPELVVRVERENWQDGQGKLLSLGTPALGNFSGLNKWSLYFVCTKVLNFRSLLGLQETKWTEVVGADSSPKKVAGGLCTKGRLKREWETSSGGSYMGY